MGLNYYALIDSCPCCGHTYKSYHIGKSSFGWSFTFRGYRDKLISPNGKSIIKIEDWHKILDKANVKIIDEENREKSSKDFWELVESKKDGKNHAKHVLEDENVTCFNSINNNSKEPLIDWIDDNGNSFSDVEFS